MGVRSTEILRREKMTIAVSQLMELFLATKRTEGKSTKTIDWYRQKLSSFVAFLGETASLPRFTIDEARAFIASLQARERKFEGHPWRPPENEGLSMYTVQGYVRSLKAFASWLVEEGFTSRNVLDRLKLPKAPMPVIEILTDEEIDRLLSTVNPKTTLGARMYTILLLLLDTGMRASELCGITLDDLHLGEDYVKVFGKGQKERLVPFGNTTKKALLRWTITWREGLAGSYGTLFLNNDGAPLTYGALQQALKRLGKRVGIPRLHAHLCRHTFAVKYLMNGGDVMTLRLILGHTTLAVTQMYMHLAAQHVQIQHRRFSPMDRLNLRSTRGRRRSAS